jgi:hypothetical protein
METPASMTLDMETYQDQSDWEAERNGFEAQIQMLMLENARLATVVSERVPPPAYEPSRRNQNGEPNVYIWVSVAMVFVVLWVSTAILFKGRWFREDFDSDWLDLGDHFVWKWSLYDIYQFHDPPIMSTLS